MTLKLQIDKKAADIKQNKHNSFWLNRYISLKWSPSSSQMCLTATLGSHRFGHPGSGWRRARAPAEWNVSQKDQGCSGQLQARPPADKEHLRSFRRTQGQGGRPLNWPAQLWWWRGTLSLATIAGTQQLHPKTVARLHTWAAATFGRSELALYKLGRTICAACLEVTQVSYGPS